MYRTLLHQSTGIQHPLRPRVPGTVRSPATATGGLSHERQPQNQVNFTAAFVGFLPLIDNRVLLRCEIEPPGSFEELQGCQAGLEQELVFWETFDMLPNPIKNGRDIHFA